ELFAAGGSTRRLLEVVRDALVDEAASLDAAAQAQLPHGIDFVAFVDALHSSPNRRPDDATLSRAATSAPLLFAAQMARVEQLLSSGFAGLFYGGDDAKPLCAGHSQGVLGALALSST